MKNSSRYVQMHTSFIWRQKRVMLYLTCLTLFIIFIHSYFKLFLNQNRTNLLYPREEGGCSTEAARTNPTQRRHNISLRNGFELDIDKYTSQLIAGVQPDFPPINRYDFPYVIPNKEKCLTTDGCRYNIRLLLIVKSAIKNFERRDAIRQTWGWEQRFPDVVIRCVFNLALAKDNPSLQLQVEREQSKYGDIIQGNFTDAYKNNTIKTMMGFRWVVENCPTAKFIMFVDDDMYVSTKNALQYANRPENYPIYLEKKEPEIVKLNDSHNMFKFDLNEPPALFFAGNVKINDPPLRGHFLWDISYSEYPFSIYPPYVPAGAYMLSFRTLRKMYYTSMYTPHFPYDDVYLGMLAKNAGIVPLTNRNFQFWAKPNDFKYVIAVHGYRNTTELISVWKKHFNLSYA